MTAFHRTTRLLLALCKLHEFLPAPKGFGIPIPKNFREFAQSKGISQIAFVRHGKTGRSSTGQDFDRLLTEEGRGQAEEAGTSFGKGLRPIFQYALVSPAPRTVETAELLLQSAGVKLDSVDFVGDSILYDGAMQPAGSQLFKKIGYAPLVEYLQSSDDADKTTARHILGAYAHNALGVMLKTLEMPSSAQNATLVMVGHAIYLPAVILGVASLLGSDDQSLSLILTTNTAEAQGYLVNVNDGSVMLLQRPSSNQAKTYE